MFHVTVGPAYGRDYSSFEAAKADWQDGKDFIILDALHPYYNKYVSIRDVPNIEVWVRYRKRTQIGRVQ